MARARTKVGFIELSVVHFEGERKVAAQATAVTVGKDAG